MTTTPQHPDCTVVIRNDVTGEQHTLLLPVTAKEAEETCLTVKQAVLFAEQLDLLALYGPGGLTGDEEEHLAVWVKKGSDSITIFWWASGSPELALERFQEIQSGRATA